jgi:ABC-type Fe2+-enterobactin transport system substrate-binding protein
MRAASPRRRFGLVALTGVVALVLAACGGEQTPATDATTPATRSVAHARGTTEVPQAPQRVVSASITMTGTLLGLDAPVVATASTRPGPVADENGFFLQWASVAVEQGVASLGGPQAPIEAIAAQRPDLIVGSAVGQDAVTEDVYARLSQIAPTIVFNHSASSWQEMSAELDAALGREEQAAAAEAEFAERASTLRIDTTHPAVALSVTPDGMNVFTADSAQGKLLESLGLRLADVAATSDVGLSGGEERKDVVHVAHENAGQFGDSSLFFVNADGGTVTGYRDGNPVLAGLPAFDEGRAYALGPESFRLDRFAALAVLDRLEAAVGG